MQNLYSGVGDFQDEQFWADSEFFQIGIQIWAKSIHFYIEPQFYIYNKWQLFPIIMYALCVCVIGRNAKIQYIYAIICINMKYFGIIFLIKLLLFLVIKILFFNHKNVIISINVIKYSVVNRAKYPILATFRHRLPSYTQAKFSKIPYSPIYQHYTTQSIILFITLLNSLPIK